MVHHIISSVLNDGDFRAQAMREIVPRHFAEVVRYGSYGQDPEAAAAFVRHAVESAVLTTDAMSAFVEMRSRDDEACGSSFDALDSIFKSYEFALAARIAGLAECAGWMGPVSVPRLVEVDYGTGVTTFLAVQMPDLLPYGMCLTALIDEGKPDRREDGRLDWYPMSWHRIRALGTKRLGFDPELQGAEAFSAKWVADLAAIHLPVPEPSPCSSSVSISEADRMRTFIDELLDGEDDGIPDPAPTDAARFLDALTEAEEVEGAAPKA